MKKSVVTVLVMVLLIALFVYTAFCGIGSVVPSTQDGVVLGLDLVGGSEITYEAVIPDGTGANAISDGLKSATTMLRQRLDVLGLSLIHI